MFLLQGPAWAAAEERKPDKPEVPGMPPGFRLGMRVEELLKLRPRARLFDLDMDTMPGATEKQVDLAKGSHLLMEESMVDGGFFTGAAYEVTDGRCTGITVDGIRIRAGFAKQRAEMIGRLISVLGPKYAKKAMWRQEPDIGAVSFLAPVFVWRDAERVVALFVTSEYENVVFGKCYMQINVWETLPPESEEKLFALASAQVLGGNPPDKAAIDRLFAPILRELAVSENDTVPGQVKPKR